MTFAKPVIAYIAAAVVAVSASSVALAAEAAPNPVRGGQLFLQCRACHAVAPGAGHTVGPNLAGVVGVKAATRPGYVYSPALIQYGQVWSTATLGAFLKRPTQIVPGTKMAFAGMADAKARGDVIAYLATLEDKK